jgi:hypothetical protein
MKHNGRPLQKTRTSGRQISELEDEMEIKGKTEELLIKHSRPANGICKTSQTPSKDQT